MKSQHLYHLVTFVILKFEESNPQTTPALQPSCLHYPDTLQCFQYGSETAEFTEAVRICHLKGAEVPLIAALENRQIIVNRSLEDNLVPFWVDLRSLTVARMSNGHTEYSVCGVGQASGSSEAIIFDYCYRKRKALCCVNLQCYPTNTMLTWSDAVTECQSNGAKMYGVGATVTEIKLRFSYIHDCHNCWIGLNTTVTASGFSDTILTVPTTNLKSIPKPGPCAVVMPTGEGVSVPCSGARPYHIICESYHPKERIGAERPLLSCPPEGCVMSYPKGGDIKITSTIILVIGIPFFVSIGVVAGILHRRRNPIYTRMPESRQRSPSQVSYIPGGSNTMF